MSKRLWAMGLVFSKGAIEMGDDPTGIWIMVDEYDPSVNEDLKANCTGRPRWNNKKGRWEFDLHWDTCIGARKVANMHGADLKISPPLAHWAEQEKARQATIPDVTDMNLVDMPLVKAQAPALAEALANRPFQTVGAAFAARNRACLIADEPGLGKTLQAIAAIIEGGITGPILVVAPKAAAQITWKKALLRWTPNDLKYLIGDNLKPGERADAVKSIVDYQDSAQMQNERCWVVTSPYYVRINVETDEYQNYVYKNGCKIIKPVGSALIQLFNVKWSAIIVDESHQTLAGCTGNKKKQSAQRLGLGALEVRKNGLRLALSGTPFRGKESYLWGQLNWLRPDKYRAYWRWVDQFFVTWDEPFGGKQIGSPISRKAIYEDAASVMIRRTKAEVAKDLKPKEYGGDPLDLDRPEGPDNPKAVWLDMVPKQARAYNQMLKQAAADLDGVTLLTNGVLAELLRLKQFAGSYGTMSGEHFVPTLPSNKFDWLVEFLDERGIDKEMLQLNTSAKDPRGHRASVPKVVVVSQFKQLIDAFAKGLGAQGIPSYKFTGDTPAKEREAIEDDWQNNPTSSKRVLFLTTTAGGVSLTLDAADEMVILDETWNSDDQVQVEDRIHRLSRIHQVIIWKVFSRGTIEEGIARNNLTSATSIAGIMDIQRLVKLAEGMAA